MIMMQTMNRGQQGVFGVLMPKVLVLPAYKKTEKRLSQEYFLQKVFRLPFKNFYWGRLLRSRSFLFVL
jgi:hypothetical protein